MLSVMESAMDGQQLNCFQYCYDKGLDLSSDATFVAWKNLKLASTALTHVLCSAADDRVSSALHDSTAEPDVAGACASMLVPDTTTFHPPVSSATSASVNAVTSDATFPFCNYSSPDDPHSDILKYPHIVKKSRKASKSAQKFFVLTSKEAYEAKLQQEREKASRELSKHQRLALKQKKAAEKATKSANESNTAQDEPEKNLDSGRKQRGQKTKGQLKDSDQKRKPRRRKTKEENWQCNSCKGFYFDSNHSNYDWVSCIQCNVIRYHSICATGYGQFDNDDTENGDFTCSQCFDNMK